MILKEGEYSLIIKGGIGKFISAVIIDNDACMRLMLNHVKIETLMSLDEDLEGIPVHFAITDDGPDTKILFYPRAGKDYDIELTYYPHAVRI